MPVGPQPIDPRIQAALPRVRAYMKLHGHQQKDVMRLTNQSQPQVSKFLAGQRHRVTDAVRAICQYAGIDLESESIPPPSLLPLSQAARQVLEEDPHAADLAARIIEALMPVLLTLHGPAAVSPKEAP